jgi:hypothetical protein
MVPDPRESDRADYAADLDAAAQGKGSLAKCAFAPDVASAELQRRNARMLPGRALRRRNFSCARGIHADETALHPGLWRVIPPPSWRPDI